MRLSHLVFTPLALGDAEEGANCGRLTSCCNVPELLLCMAASFACFLLFGFGFFRRFGMFRYFDSFLLFLFAFFLLRFVT